LFFVVEVYYFKIKLEFTKMTLLAQLKNQKPKVDTLLDFALIGAGIAGLTAANKISDEGHKVAVFEKARGTGGRLSSKRVTGDNGDCMAFDLGCPSITSVSEAFSDQLEDWHSKGVVEPWCLDYQNLSHYVAVPRNSALTRYLSKELECHFSTCVSSIHRINNIWHLFTIENENENEKLLAMAKNVIIAAPPVQAFDLLPRDSHLRNELEKVKVGAQWVMGLEIDNALSGSHPIQYPQSDIIYSISQESRKPKRRDGDSHSENNLGPIILQIQASSDWTLNHLDSTKEQVVAALSAELEHCIQQPLEVITAYVHRWLYSCVSQGLETREGYLWDEGLGLIGDYLNKGVYGVESAWLSGKQLADWLTLTDSAGHS
jgi:renalase